MPLDSTFKYIFHAKFLVTLKSDQYSDPHSDKEMDLDPHLKVPKREIFDRSDFPDFYTIKSSWVGDLFVKILTYYFNF